MIEVLSPGALTTIQDEGRAGLAAIGVPPSGAADRTALEFGNVLVGNPAGAAALEFTFSGPRLLFHSDATIALSGAPIEAAVDGAPLGPGGPHHLRAGSELVCGRNRIGLRSYLAVRGGIAVEPVLGSRSTDTLTGIGPPPLRAGDRLPVGRGAIVARAGARPEEPLSLPAPAEEPLLRLHAGPRADWFSDDALRLLVAAPYTVSASSNRVGVRLEGATLERARPQELPPEGMVTGGIQVPPNGLPIVLGPDHPTTGGYPVIAVIDSADLAAAGQLRVGAQVRFTLLR